MNTNYILKTWAAILLLAGTLFAKGADGGVVISEQEFSVKEGVATESFILTVEEDVEEHRFNFKLLKKSDATVKKEFTVEPLLQDDFNTKLLEAIKGIMSAATSLDSIQSPNNKSTLFIRAVVAINMGIDKNGPVIGSLLVRDSVRLVALNDTSSKPFVVKENVPLKWIKKDWVIRKEIKDSKIKLVDSVIFSVKKKYLTRLRKKLDAKSIKVKSNAAPVDGESTISFDLVVRTDTGKNYALKSATIEFDGGYIERIIAVVNIGSADYEFKNNFPIPIAGFRDNERLESYFLYNKLFNSKGAYQLRLGDIIKYSPVPHNGRIDFSPGDQAHTFTARTESYHLTQSPTVELFKAKVFSDFMGIGEDKANGLIQTQIERRFNLWTKRLFTRRTVRVSNYGLFQWVEPFVLISKMEKKNRELNTHKIEQIVNGTILSRQYITPIELMNYEHFSTGARFNFFLLQIAPLKSYFYLNGIATFGSTTLADSVRKIENNKIVTDAQKPVTYEATHMRFAPEIVWRIGGDGRVNFEMAYSAHWNFMFNRTALMVHNAVDYKKDRMVNSAYPVGRLSAQISVKPYSIISANSNKKLPDRGELFARFAYNHSWTDYKDNYMQVQVGYNFFILAALSNKN
jgi:hypothetical protein